MQAGPSSNIPEGGERVLRNVALLALPLLAAQRDMLGICKNAIKDESCILPMQNFALRQFYAMMMVFDPQRKFRDACAGVEDNIGKTCQETVPKLVYGSVALIEAQEAVLSSVIDALTKMKNAPGKAKQDGG
jgi:hypothetical protein